jgi:hypothetical protein
MSGRIFYQEQVMTAVEGIITAHSFAEKLSKRAALLSAYSYCSVF